MAITKIKREKKQLAIGIRQLAKAKAKKKQSGVSSRNREQAIHGKPGPSAGNRQQEKARKKNQEEKQSGVSSQQSTKPHTFTLPRREVFNFPQAEGRVVREIEFSIDDDYKCLEFRFEDNTTLSFEFKPSFVWEAYFARWKSGEQSILHRWPLRKG